MSGQTPESPAPDVPPPPPHRPDGSLKGSIERGNKPSETSGDRDAPSSPSR